MDLKAEKRTFAVLGGVAVLVLILIPLAFRELEPDYQAAYSMDPAKKKRFASKDEAAPVLPNLPPTEAQAAASAAKAREQSVHRAPPAASRARGTAPDAPDAAPSGAENGGSGAGPASGAAPHLKPVAGAGGYAGGRPSGGSLNDGRAPGLEDAKFGGIDPAAAPNLTLTPGAAGAAKLAQGMGLGDIAGMMASASATAGRNKDCAETSRELKPKLAAAGAAHKDADAALKASGCAKDACGRYADDCQIRERSPEEARVAARRCRCDRIACRAKETCGEVNRLMCEQQQACSNGAAVSCVESCD